MQERGVIWDVLRPTASSEVTVSQKARRLPDLNGKKIGLFWNGKPGGDVLSKVIQKLLQDKYEKLNFELFVLHVNVGAENIRRMATCDAVIGFIGD